MSGPASLERAYRRLLSWYPAGHRREHEEEMLGVLLAAARDGQRRPRPSEAVNLIGGALRIRLRRAPAEGRLAIWRDALALYSVTAPLLMLLLTNGTPLLRDTFTRAAYEPSPAWFGLHTLLLGQLVLVVVVLLRLRRIAIVVALAYLSVYVITTTHQYSFNPPLVTFLLLITLCEVVALAASPGPRRGLALIRGRGLLLIALAGVALAVLLASSVGFSPSDPPLRAASVVVLAMLLAGLAVVSPLSRCLLLLLAIPGVPFADTITTNWTGLTAIMLPGNPPDYYVAGFYFMPVLVTALILGSARRARRRPAAGGAS